MDANELLAVVTRLKNDFVSVQINHYLINRLKVEPNSKLIIYLQRWRGLFCFRL